MIFSAITTSAFATRAMAVCSLSLMLFITASASIGSGRSAPSLFALEAPFGLSSLQTKLFNTVPQNRYSLTITNRSKWSIDEVYVETSENTHNWGKDWLGDATLDENEYLIIKNLKPGEYDVRFVDEEDDECILKNIAITKNTAWTITTKWLEKCEGYK